MTGKTFDRHYNIDSFTPGNKLFHALKQSVSSSGTKCFILLKH